MGIMMTSMQTPGLTASISGHSKVSDVELRGMIGRWHELAAENAGRKSHQRGSAYIDVLDAWAILRDEIYDALVARYDWGRGVSIGGMVYLPRLRRDGSKDVLTGTFDVIGD